MPKDIAASRRELKLGVLGMVLVGTAIIILGSQTLHGLPNVQNLDLDTVLTHIHAKLGDATMNMFALKLMEAGLIAAIVITASTAWAVGEAFDIPRSINAPARQALGFYLPALTGTAIAAGVVMLPELPLGFLNLAVQVIATIFMPSALLFLLMLLNDREIMGDHVNSRARNAASIAIMVGLIICNALYGLSTVLPHIFGG